MNAATLADELMVILNEPEVEFTGESRNGIVVADAYSFDGSGLLTRDDGVVLRLASGDEFQITIVQSVVGDGDTSDECDECGGPMHAGEC
jgi:hypothetical protein